MIPSSMHFATEGVAAAFLKVPQVLHAAFVESLTGWIVGLMVIVLGALMIGMVRVVIGSRSIECEISGDYLVLHHGRCCQHKVALSELNLAQASLTDLSFDPGNQPRRRLTEPGCSQRGSGWYLLRNGTRAIVFLADPMNVVRIPTTEGYTLLFSVPEPAQLLANLRAAKADRERPSLKPAAAPLPAALRPSAMRSPGPRPISTRPTPLPAVALPAMEPSPMAASQLEQAPLPEPVPVRPEPKRNHFSNSTVKKQKKATAPMATHERASSGVV